MRTQADLIIHVYVTGIMTMNYKGVYYLLFYSCLFRAMTKKIQIFSEGLSNE